MQARHREVHTGSEELIGAHGTVRSPLDPVGHVFVKGALWRAHTADDAPIELGRGGRGRGDRRADADRRAVVGDAGTESDFHGVE